MKLNGAQVIAADRMTVWRALNNPEVLKASIPGCEEMDQTSPTHFEAVVKQKVGPVKATFNGTVDLLDVVEGESLTLSGEGKGGVAGMAKGEARVILRDVEGGTELSYEADASVAGKLAQLGSRLITGVANKMANSFFESFKGVVEGDGTAEAGGPGASASEASSTTANEVWETARTIASHGGGAAVAGGAAAAAVAASAKDAVLDATEAAGLSPNASGADAVAKASDAIADAARDATATVDHAIAGASARVEGAADMAKDVALDHSDASGRAAHDAARGVEAVAEDAQSTIAGSVAAAQDRMVQGIEEARQASSGLGTEAQAAVAGAAGSVAATVTESVSDAGEHAAAAANRVQHSVDGLTADAGAVVGNGSATLDAAVDRANHAMAEGVDDARDTLVEAHTDVEAVDHGAEASDWAKGAAVAAAGTVAAAASGLAARAGTTLDSVHEGAKERVISAGKDIDEAKEWTDAKTHAGTAFDEAGDAIGDAWDAAKAKVQGATDVAAKEWGEAKQNASEAVGAAGSAASSAYKAAKGEAADIAQNPRMGPKGKPWYLWIILAAVAAVVLMVIF